MIRHWSPRDRAGDPNAADLATARGRQVTLPDPTLFRNIETQTFHFTRRISIPDLVERLTTYSYVISASDEVKAVGRARAAAALTEQFPGATEIEVPMRSRCWRSDRVARC